MVNTYGLTHIAIAVRDAERTAKFYANLFGAEVCFRNAGKIQVKTPGCHDVITFDETMPNAGQAGGVMHFGFRLKSREDIDEAIEEAERSGGKLKSRGEFGAGYPYAYLTDPDGYEIELWFE